MYYEMTKHIDAKLHFIWDVVFEGAISVKKIVTTENLADMMTKPIPTVKFKYCLVLIDFGSTWVLLRSFCEND